jgi:hypothetical protein
VYPGCAGVPATLGFGVERLRRYVALVGVLFIEIRKPVIPKISVIRYFEIKVPTNSILDRWIELRGSFKPNKTTGGMFICSGMLENIATKNSTNIVDLRTVVDYACIDQSNTKIPALLPIPLAERTVFLSECFNLCIMPGFGDLRLAMSPISNSKKN